MERFTGLYQERDYDDFDKFKRLIKTNAPEKWLQLEKVH